MIYELDGRRPRIAPDAYVAPNATVIGSVTLEPKSSVWFNAVIRADCDEIVIGEESNIQDGAVLHVDPGFGMRIGRRVTVGHLAMMHGCTVGDGTLIGINAVVLNGAKIGKGCLVAANALVREGMEVPDGAVVMGSPGKIVRELDERMRAEIEHGAIHYVENGKMYAAKLKARDGE